MHTKNRLSSKLLAFILAFVMAFTLIIPSAFAENKEDDTGTLAADASIRGGVEVSVKDYETKESAALGSANLQAILTIYNENEYSVTVNDETYNSGDAVYSMTTDAETGYAATSNDLLPYGHYRIAETKLPEGYTGEGITEREFDITEDGVLVDLTGDNAIYNQVVRADFEVYKTDENGEPMADVGFSIKSETTGETHYFMTDENGYYSSSSDYVLHSTNTNRDRTGGLTARGGIWFGEDAEVNDDLGALPCDTYTISEYRTADANWSYVMQTKTFTITGADNDTVVNLDIVNTEMKIQTEALFADNNSHYHIADGIVTIVDIVSYENLLTNHKYYVECFLYDATTGEYVNAYPDEEYYGYDSNFTEVNNIVTTHITTNDGKGDGTADGSFAVEFELDLSQFEGHQIVVYEDVYDVDQASLTPPIVYEENPDALMQTLYIPSIHTTALDSETGTHMSFCDNDITIVDTVDYVNLEVGAEYTVYGTLMNKETGEAVLDKDGNEIIAETTFVPETKDGSIDVMFNFDGTGLDGIVTVVFEDLYSEGIEYAVHADLEDEGQTVYIPKLHTLAWAEETGTNLATATKDTVLYDTVWYSGLQPGEDYHVLGVLLDAETRQAEVDSEGNEIYSDYGPFTAESSDGQVTVEYNIDASQLAGRKTVFFEILYHVAYEDGAVVEDVVEEILDELEGENIDIEEAADDPTTFSIVTYASETETDDFFVRGMGNFWYYTGNDEGEAIYGTIEGVTGWWYVDGGHASMRTVFTMINGEAYINGEMYEVIDGLIQGYGVEEEPDVTEPDVTEPGIEEPDDSGNSEPVIHTGTPIYTLVAEEDIADAEQETIYFPTIHTTAINKDTGTHEGISEGTITIVDTVEYTNLLPGVEYTMSGELYNADTEDSMSITAETVFIPETADGSVDVEFTFDASDLGDVTITVFEYCYYDGNIITEHTDITDTEQQVRLTPPETDVPVNGTTPDDAVPNDATPDDTTVEDNGGEIQTGEIIALSAFAVAAVIVAAVAVTTTVMRKKKV